MTIGKKLLGMRVVKEDGRQAGGPGQPLAGIPAKRTDDGQDSPVPAPLSAITIQSMAHLGYTARRHPGRRLHPASHFKNRDRIRRADSAQLCDRATPEVGPDKSEPIILNLRRVRESQSQE